jgi:hypothetical protein
MKKTTKPPLMTTDEAKLIVRMLGHLATQEAAGLRPNKSLAARDTAALWNAPRTPALTAVVPNPQPTSEDIAAPWEGDRTQTRSQALERGRVLARSLKIKDDETALAYLRDTPADPKPYPWGWRTILTRFNELCDKDSVEWQRLRPCLVDPEETESLLARYRSKGTRRRRYT